MKKNDNKAIEAVIGTGNVFKDLGYQNPEEAKAKADLAIQIRQIIESRKLSQKQAGEILGIDQPKVSVLVGSRLSKYSIGRLMRFLGLLGRDIEIKVTKHSKQNDAWIYVSRHKKTLDTRL